MGFSGLSCGEKCAKYSLMISCLIVFIMGIAVMSVSIWAAVDTSSFLNAFDKADNEVKPIKEVTDFLNTFSPNTIRHTAIALAIFGGVLTLLGFMGCCGAMKEVKFLLVVFAIIMIILLLAILAAAIYVLVAYGTDIEEAVKDSYKKIEAEEKSKNIEWVKTLTYYLEKLSSEVEDKCCGGTGGARPATAGVCVSTKTCPDWFYSFIKAKILPIGIIGLVCVFAMLFGLICSCVLYQALRSATTV